MAWLYLIIAGLFEIAWAVGLKYTDGWTRPIPSIATAIGMIISFVFLSQALKHLPLGTAYAVWTGIGTVGTVIFGILFFHESKDLMRIIFILLIVIGIVGLNLVSNK